MPSLGIVGKFDHEWSRRLARQAAWLPAALRSFRYVGFTQLREDVELLSRKIRARWTEREIADFGFVAIPRGGLVVLGLLSYALDLAPAQIGVRPTTVVVDDCSLTGARFSRFVAGIAPSEVVFAHLYSHADLRGALSAAHPSVTCVSARDLDLADLGLGGDEVAASSERWAKRLGGQGLWTGPLEWVGFPWGEPDRWQWDPERQQVEPCWRLIPPSRGGKKGTGQPAQVQIQFQGTGDIRPAARVLFADLPDGVLVANLDDGTQVWLEGVAGELWRAMLTTGDLTLMAQRVAMTSEIDVSVAAGDARRLVQELRDRGLILGR